MDGEIGFDKSSALSALLGLRLVLYNIFYQLIKYLQHEVREFVCFCFNIGGSNLGPGFGVCSLYLP